MKFTQTQLKAALRYDPETGKFFRTDGTPAGSIDGGYIRICVFGRRYSAGPLAWFYMMGEWPPHDVDHKNRNRSDNRWVNLREASRQENNRNRSRASNNRSGHKGVCFDRSRNKWQARLQMGRFINLGRFARKEDAIAAYEQAAREHFGEFAPCVS